jgi:hypothetical protein
VSQPHSRDEDPGKLHGTPLRLLQRRLLPFRLICCRPASHSISTVGCVLPILHCYSGMYTCRRHAHTLEQAADHTTCPVTAPLCALNLTALLVRSVVGRTPGTVCFALAAHLTSRGIGLGHCVSPPRISELERHRKLPPVDSPGFFFPRTFPSL